MIVFIDSGILGRLCNPNSSAEVDAVRDWLYSLLAKGIFVVSSHICDYEVTRSDDFKSSAWLVTAFRGEKKPHFRIFTETKD